VGDRAPWPVAAIVDVLSDSGPEPLTDRGRRDRHLVELVLAGETGAFVDLYGDHVAAVSRVVARYARGGEARADAVQETFARALAKLPTLRDAERLRPWLLAIARHVAVDESRHRGRNIPVAEPPDTGTDQDPSCEVAGDLTRLAGLVRSCVAGLSGRDAAAVTMVASLGFSVGDVASALGVSHGAAKVILHRARLRLRQAVTLEAIARGQAKGCVEFAAASACGPREGALHAGRCPACASAVKTELDEMG
jgi:RNA polymerase sigma-70 factor, ECF subfamily